MEMQFEDFDAFDSGAPKTVPLQEAASPLVRLQYLIDNTPAIIYSTVPSGDFKMTFVSRNVTNVLGYTPEEMVADPNFWFDHIHPDDAPEIFSSLAQVFVDGRRTYEYRFRGSDGKYLWMHDNLRLIRDEHGAPLEVIGSLTDITARKAMEEDLQRKGEEQRILIGKLQEADEQLLQAEKMASVGQLAAGIAHEINNPIGFVNSNIGALKNYVATLLATLAEYEKLLANAPAMAASVAELRKQADLDFLQDDVNDLMAESLHGLRRVKDIVTALSDFSKVGETDWQYSDLHQGLDSTLALLASDLKSKATVDRHYGTMAPVHCVASQMNQVFMNILRNAIDAITEKGVISIHTGTGQTGVWISILDNGCGIAPDNIKRIFEPFFTTKPVGSGTGLGLSLAYSIVKRHGGHIDVRSVLGKGTRLTIHLPNKSS